MIPGAQYVDGNVVVRYKTPIPKYIKIGTKEYICDVRYGVSLLFVAEAEVQSLLDFEEGCNCGGGKRKPFTLASEVAIKVWREGNY